MFEYIVYGLLGVTLSLQFVLLWQIKRFGELKGVLYDSLRENREEQTNAMNQQFQSLGNMQKNQLDSFSKQLTGLTQLNETKLENVRAVVEERLHKMQSDNSEKLEKMRATVEEKLHDTLEKRLGESFKIVSERLELVHKGLGEMQNLASGVGDLKKVLSNVKTRGIWGEVQLDAIIEQILTPNQYENNVAVKPNSQDRVECAIKLPGKDSDNSSIYLPIDAKFPLEDFQRLVEAQDKGDVSEIEVQSKLLENNIKKVAKMIAEKYIHPPYTTDFAIMFLPIEALYAEVLRRPGLIEKLQKDHRIVITSPTTLSAILNSLQMGFRTLAIEKRSSEVWKVLGTVKTEFVKFADVLNKTRSKLDQASKVIGDAETRTRVIQRHLKGVEEISTDNQNDNLVIEELENVEND